MCRAWKKDRDDRTKEAVSERITSLHPLACCASGVPLSCLFRLVPVPNPDISSGRGIMAEDWARQIGLERRNQ